MSIHVKSGGTWTRANTIFVKVGSSWNKAKEVWIKNSGEWKMAHLRELDITFSANTAEYNIKAAAIAAGWDQETPLFANVVVEPGVVVYGANSNTNASFAITTSYNWPLGSYVEIHNRGSIVGRGGDGGAGGSATNLVFAYFPEDGSPGQRGGPALIIGVPTYIYNNGRIAGGGGGGGGGGAVGRSTNLFGFANVDGGSGGGGGQSGMIQSSGGAGGLGGGTIHTDGAPGANGTFAGPGNGGTVVRAGGRGGTWGNTGLNGTSGGGSGGGGGAGGPGGNSIRGISNVTFMVTGILNGGTA